MEASSKDIAQAYPPLSARSTGGSSEGDRRRSDLSVEVMDPLIRPQGWPPSPQTKGEGFRRRLFGGGLSSEMSSSFVLDDVDIHNLVNIQKF